MYEYRVVFYLAMVACFIGAGVCEFGEGNYRMGLASTLLAAVQALIFLGGRG